MTLSNFNDSLKVVLRSGNSDDPFVSKTDVNKKIINNEISLDEIPDEWNRVVINGYSEINDEQLQFGYVLKSNEFVVNYQNGRISFNPSEEGKSVTANYKGRGVILYPASRIYTNTKDKNNIEMNLQEVIDEVDMAVGSFVHVGDYNSTTTYKPRNIVNYNTFMYINTVECIGIPPTNSTYWQRFQVDTLQLKIEARTTDPTNPEVGRIWLRSDLS